MGDIISQPLVLSYTQYPPLETGSASERICIAISYHLYRARSIIFRMWLRVDFEFVFGWTSILSKRTVISVISRSLLQCSLSPAAYMQTLIIDFSMLAVWAFTVACQQFDNFTLHAHSLWPSSEACLQPLTIYCRMLADSDISCGMLAISGHLVKHAYTSFSSSWSMPAHWPARARAASLSGRFM